MKETKKSKINGHLLRHQWSILQQNQRTTKRKWLSKKDENHNPKSKQWDIDMIHSHGKTNMFSKVEACTLIGDDKESNTLLAPKMQGFGIDNEICKNWEERSLYYKFRNKRHKALAKGNSKAQAQPQSLKATKGYIMLVA